MNIIQDMGIGIPTGLNSKQRKQLIDVLNNKLHIELSSNTKFNNIISAINSLNFGNANISEVLKDKTFSNNDNLNLIGTFDIQKYIKENVKYIEQPHLLIAQTDSGIGPHIGSPRGLMIDELDNIITYGIQGGWPYLNQIAICDKNLNNTYVRYLNGEDNDFDIGAGTNISKVQLANDGTIQVVMYEYHGGDYGTYHYITFDKSLTKIAQVQSPEENPIDPPIADSDLIYQSAYYSSTNHWTGNSMSIDYTNRKILFSIDGTSINIDSPYKFWNSGNCSMGKTIAVCYFDTYDNPEGSIHPNPQANIGIYSINFDVILN